MYEKISLNFERNEYFYGKLLTVDNFELEQNYFNNKRRLYNQNFYSGGVLRGLQVKISDSNQQEVNIFPGIAYDYQGHEMAIGQIQTRKVEKAGANEGYSYLCISYTETKAEETFNINDTLNLPQDKAYDRLLEGYCLSWEPEALNQEEVSNAFWSKQLVYKAENYLVTQKVVRYAEKTDSLTIEVQVHKFHKDDSIKAAGYTLYGTQIGEFPIPLDTYPCPDIINTFQIEIPVSETEEEQVTVSTQVSPPIRSEKKWTVQWIKGSLADYLKEKYNGEDINQQLEEEHKLYLARVHYTENNGEYTAQYCEKLPFEQYLEGSYWNHFVWSNSAGNGERDNKKTNVQSLKFDMKRKIVKGLLDDEMIERMRQYSFYHTLQQNTGMYDPLMKQGVKDPLGGATGTIKPGNAESILVGYSLSDDVKNYWNVQHSGDVYNAEKEYADDMDAVVKIRKWIAAENGDIVLEGEQGYDELMNLKLKKLMLTAEHIPHKLGKGELLLNTIYAVASYEEVESNVTVKKFQAAADIAVINHGDETLSFQVTLKNITLKNLNCNVYWAADRIKD